MSVLLTLSSRDKPQNFPQETHFGRLYSGSHSFGQCPTLMTIGKDRNKNRSENKKLCLPSLENETSRYLNFSVCWRVTQFFGKNIRQGALICANLSFNRTNFHPSIQACITKPIKCILEITFIRLNNARSLANSRCQTLQFPNVIPLTGRTLLFPLCSSIIMLYWRNIKGITTYWRNSLCIINNEQQRRKKRTLVR